MSKQVVYTDHTGRRQLYCTLDTSVLGRGELGTVYLCRAWLSQLYRGYPEAVRQAIKASVTVESA